MNFNADNKATCRWLYLFWLSGI